MTNVPRNRPILHPKVRCGTSFVVATDPPAYTRTEIGQYARKLLVNLYSCSDVRSSNDRLKQREFVREMIRDRGAMYA